MRSLEAKSPQTQDQFDHEQTGKDKSSILQALADLGDPGVVLDPLVAINQCYEDVGQQAGDVEGHQSQNQIVFLLGDEQALTSLALPVVGAHLVRALLLVQVLLVLEQGLLLVALLVHGEKTRVSQTKLKNAMCDREADDSLMPNFGAG